MEHRKMPQIGIDGLIEWVRGEIGGQIAPISRDCLRLHQSVSNIGRAIGRLQAEIRKKRIELQKCSCGGEAEYVCVSNGGMIRCTDCGKKTIKYATPDMAAGAWNDEMEGYGNG